MNGKELLRLIGEIDDKYITECEAYKPRDKKKIFAVAKYVAAAASVCLLVASFVLLVRIDNRGDRGYNTSTLMSGAFMGPHKEIVYYDEWLEDFLSAGNIIVEDMGSGTDGNAGNNPTVYMVYHSPRRNSWTNTSKCLKRRSVATIERLVRKWNSSCSQTLSVRACLCGCLRVQLCACVWKTS